MATPPWQAAAAGQRALAGQINQFLGTHTSAWIYQGVQRAAQATGSGLYQSTASRYLAQSFTTAVGQTTVGQVWLQASAVAGSPVTAAIAPFTLNLYQSSGGLPSGPALASTTVNEQYVYAAPFWLAVPLSASGLSAGAAYQLVALPAGSSSAYYAWQQSNQVAGAAASTDGSTWTAQAYGLMYQVFDQAASGRLQFMYDDSGARWTQFTYDAQGRYSTITEYAASQSATPFQSVRTFAYSGNYLAGVS